MRHTDSKNQQIMILGKPAYRRVSFFTLQFATVLLFLCTYTLSAQGIHGVVTATFTQQPIAGAEVVISLGDTITFQTHTDSLGRYIYVTTQPGRFLVEIIATGYQPVIQSDIILDGYITRTVWHAMDKTDWTLQAVVVRSTSGGTTPYIRKITNDDMVQIAGNYDDPVRAALSGPGLIALNDQANHFSARGKSPVFNTWQLEGLDIVNPNHTSNAGTFSDLPTQYGGGINMFSAQTLGSTDFYLGINPMQVNNISGASSNMHLHETTSPEWRVKAGLLGFEVGGGSAIGQRSILDFNLRYSFTGVLTALGADFGGERISYYDGVVSFRNQGPNHAFKAFAWYGYSENLFDHPTDTTEIEEYKDFFDIDYGNKIIGSGATYHQTLGPKLNLRTGAAFSANESTYTRYGTFETQTDSIDDKDQITIFSGFAELSMQHNARVKSTAGMNYRNRSYPTSSHFKYPYLPFPEESMLRPYVSTTIDLNKSMRAEVGADLSWSLLYESVDPGYRAAIRWNYGIQSSFFGGVRHGAGERVIESNFTDRSAHLLNTFFEGGWSSTGKKHAVTLDAYAHRMNGLIRLDLMEGFIHMADYPYTATTSLPDWYSIEAKAFYYGAEGQWEYRHNGWRMFINQSLYRSERQSPEKDNDPGRYNGQYATHAVISREIIREKQGKSRIWNFSLRGMWHGGLWEQEIDIPASAQYYTTIHTNSGTFDRRIPDYKRLDLSIVRTIGDSKIRWRYALDIQNVLGLTNIAYTYYDPYLNAISQQEQLGLIPVLSVQASW